MQLINTLMFALEADTVEYGEWKTGQRTEGATYAIFSFTRKITQSIGGALGAFALALGGYITKLDAGQVQPDSAITAIKASMGLVPAAAAILAMLAFIAYPLTEKKYRDIVAENDNRKRAILREGELRHGADPVGHLTFPEARTANHQQSKGMTMVDLSAKPFHLDEEAIGWVHDTIASMTLPEKIGQLFINHNNSYSPEYLDDVLENYHVGGMRYRSGDAAEIQAHARYAQSRSKVPLLIASNPEMGGFGSSNDGTFVCTHLQAGSHPDASIAREMGDVAGAECHAIGCNWAFAPIVDIHYNWRNTVISTRSFGNTPEVVIERAKEYFDGISAHNMVCAMKHFPGDGIDERDQHVVTSYNTLPADEWDQTYGRVYREMIDYGVQSVMVGHIGAPELSRKYRPGIHGQRDPAGHPVPGTAAGPAARRIGFQRPDPDRRVPDDRVDRRP